MGPRTRSSPPRRRCTRRSELKPNDRSAYYAEGWHLLTRDLQGPRVWADIEAFVLDPDAPLPSGAPVVPGAPTRANN